MPQGVDGILFASQPNGVRTRSSKDSALRSSQVSHQTEKIGSEVANNGMPCFLAVIHLTENVCQSHLQILGVVSSVCRK